MQHLVILDEVENGKQRIPSEGCFNQEHQGIGANTVERHVLANQLNNFSEKNISFSNKSCSVSEHIIIIIIATITISFSNTVSSWCIL